MHLELGESEACYNTSLESEEPIQSDGAMGALVPPLKN